MLSSAGRTGAVAVVAALHELRGAAFVAPRLAAVALTLRLPRSMTGLAIAAVGVVAVAAFGMAMRRRVAVIVAVFATVIRPQLVAVVLGAMMAVRTGLTAAVVVAIVRVAVARTGMLVALRTLVTIRAVLSIGARRTLCTIMAYRTIRTFLARGALAIGNAEHSRPVGTAFALVGGPLTVAVTTMGLTVPTRGAVALTMLTSAATAIAFAARAFTVVRRVIARQRGQNFAADIVDDFDRLLHHAFDGADFLAF